MNTAHVFSAGAAAVLTAVMAFVSTEQRVAAQASQVGKQPETEVTVVGCIQRETDYRRANASGKGGPAGTGAGLGNEFVLVNARRATAGAPASPSEPDPCGTSGTGEAYELTGNRERELQGFVGRRVEITGMRKEAKTDEGGKPTGGVDPLGQDLRLFELNVRSFREVAAGQRSEATRPAEPAAQPVSPAQPAAPQPTGQIAQAELPRTASPLPLAGLIGLLSIAGGLGVRSLRRR